MPAAKKTAKRKRFKRRPRPADETGSREWRSETERAKERTLPCRKFWSLAVRGRARAPLPADCGISPACPLYYLDRLWHKADRTHITREEFDRVLAEWLARPGLDHRRRLQPQPSPSGWPPATRCFSWTTPPKSAWTPSPTGWAQVREDMPWVEETLDPEFYQWVSDFARDERPLILDALAGCTHSPEVITFRSRAEADAWLAAFGPLPEGCGGAPTLRPYRPEDCPALAHLFYETVHTVCAADLHPRPARGLGARQRPRPAAWDASFQAHITLVAEIGGRLAGFGDLDPAAGYLDWLYVSRDFQRRGVASALCDALEQASRARPLTTHASRTARPFFEKRGYRVLHSQQVERRGQQLENFVMEKP